MKNSIQTKTLKGLIDYVLKGGSLKSLSTGAEMRETHLQRISDSKTHTDGKCNGLLHEETFKELYQITSDARRKRAENTHTKPPTIKVDSKGREYLVFNVKSDPTTEDKRHKGYIKFLDIGVTQHKSNIECSCDCKDFKYRWEVSNKMIGASVIKYSNGAFPVVTNPAMLPSLCKHIASMRDYII